MDNVYDHSNPSTLREIHQGSKHIEEELSEIKQAKSHHTQLHSMSHNSKAPYEESASENFMNNL